MIEYRAHAERDPMTNSFAIRLLRIENGVTYQVTVDGPSTRVSRVPDGVEIAPLVRLPGEAVQAIIGALDKHRTTSECQRVEDLLREAWDYERWRTDMVLEKLLGISLD